MPAGWFDGGSGVFVLLVALTLLPAAFVLWFTGDAVTRESAAAQQRVLEAYRGQLRLVRSRLDGLWRAYTTRLDARGDAARQFSQLMADGLGDGAVLLDENGAVAYPDRGGSATAPGDERHEAIDVVAARLNDYGVHMPSRGRLAGMDRLRARAPNVMLPTQAALRLSLEMIEAERPAPVHDVVRQTAVPDVWALTSADGRVVAFYRTGRLEALMHDFLHEVTPEGIRFIATPPDVPADVEAIAAGPWLPGWQLSFVPLDVTPFDATGRRQRTLYLSVGAIGLAVIVIAGAASGRTLRRHMHIARMKTDLVAAASHELRTPLASMRVLVEGLLDDAVLEPVKTRQYLQMIAAENVRLSRLIENFLTFSRIERGSQRFAFAPVAAAAVVGNAVETVRDRLPEGGTLRVEIAPDLPPLMADADALGSALVNLLDNAFKYTPADPRIVVRARRDGGFALLQVEDNGIGIPLREQRRIFRRFYRVDQRLSRETGGVGLGLSIVELIVRGHGGSVSVVSQPGAGSTFTLRLPGAEPGQET